ncbi:MAG: hypothetical protein AAGM22_27945, partial [Acidobacteriota bacterium]
HSGRHALRRHLFDVPAGAVDAPALLAPILIDDGAALVIRDRTADGVENDYPFRIGDAEEYVPNHAPTLGGDPTRVCLMGYHLTRAGLLLDATVFDVTGGGEEALGQDRVGLVGRSEADALGLDRLYLSLETHGLAEGEYELRASIRDPENGFEQTVRSPFRIGR